MKRLLLAALLVGLFAGQAMAWGSVSVVAPPLGVTLSTGPPPPPPPPAYVYVPPPAYAYVPPPPVYVPAYPPAAYGYKPWKHHRHHPHPWW